jgi:hypothetical protein
VANPLLEAEIDDGDADEATDRTAFHVRNEGSVTPLARPHRPVRDDVTLREDRWALLEGPAAGPDTVWGRTTRTGRRASRPPGRIRIRVNVCETVPWGRSGRPTFALPL